ncbi:MAG: hypothetical protein ACJ8H8_08990 [Geminicoccaceae bacterium]
MAKAATWALGVALLVGAAGAARADKIDGNWCAGDGRVMSIEGPRIVTPGGTPATGDYSRHAFAYTVPAPDKEAGTAIRLVLLNEDTVRVVAGPPPEIWHRCDVTS